ncbi:MAG: four helix bundle protein [candidate division WOR-3 bacterium]|nr:MAG: four helix bundle protein [candidate division WOR-3 bacterium]
MENNENRAIKHFTDLRVWQKSHDLFVSIYGAVDKLPRTTTAGIIFEQLLRSSGSISASIAEGFYSRGRRKYIRYLETAHCGAAETENWLIKLTDCHCMEREIVEPWIETCVGIGKMLNALMRKLEERAKPKPKADGT